MLECGEGSELRGLRGGVFIAKWPRKARGGPLSSLVNKLHREAQGGGAWLGASSLVLGVGVFAPGQWLCWPCCAVERNKGGDKVGCGCGLARIGLVLLFFHVGPTLKTM